MKSVYVVCFLVLSCSQVIAQSNMTESVEGARERKAASDEMSRQKKEIEARYSKLVSTASPALSEYVTKMKTAAENIGHANAAVICNLRSQAWFSPFDIGFYQLSGAEGARLHITAAEKIKAQPIFSDAGELATRIDTEQYGCRNLVNTPLMHSLDKIRDSLVGGYK